MRANTRVRIKVGWWGEGLTGRVLGRDVFVEQYWTPILWDGDEDPSFFKTAGIEVFTDTPKKANRRPIRKS